MDDHVTERRENAEWRSLNAVERRETRDVTTVTGVREGCPHRGKGRCLVRLAGWDAAVWALCKLSRGRRGSAPWSHWLQEMKGCLRRMVHWLDWTSSKNLHGPYFPRSQASKTETMWIFMTLVLAMEKPRITCCSWLQRTRKLLYQRQQVHLREEGWNVITSAGACFRILRNYFAQWVNEM